MAHGGVFFLYLLKLINLLYLTMRRIVICGMALLLGGAISARSKTESLLFV